MTVLVCRAYIKEDALLELLVTLIEKFEEEHYPVLEGNPHSMLLHLMEAQKAQAKALGEFFHVSPALFLSAEGSS